MKRLQRIARHSRDFSEALRTYTRRELAFLNLHAVLGPVTHLDDATFLLDYSSPQELRRSIMQGHTRLHVFRPPRRLKLSLVATKQLAELMVDRRMPIPNLPIPEQHSFCDDDTSGPEILVLGRALTASEYRAMSLEQLTILRMHARYGPVLKSTTVAELLGFSDSSTLRTAIEGQRLPIRLVAPKGRAKFYGSTRSVATVLARWTVENEPVTLCA